MKRVHGLDVVPKRMSKVFHLDAPERPPRVGTLIKTEVLCEWVIIYRTEHGFCCVHRGMPIDFREMLDLRVWAEEQNVQTYFMGL